MGYPIKQSQTAQPLEFLLVSSTDHISAVTGATPTVTLSKNGAAFASPAGAVSEIGNGWYKVAGNATDSGTLGPLLLHATATGADPCDEMFPVVAFDPQDATRLGLSALPGAAANANGGLPILSSAGTTLAYTISTVTTYTGNTPQTGDAYARIGATGSGLTSLAPASTALSTATWTATRAGKLDNLDAAISTRSTYAGGAVASVTGDVGGKVLGGGTSTITAAGAWVLGESGEVLANNASISVANDNISEVLSRIGLPATDLTTAVADVKTDTSTLTSRLTAARAGYLDNLNVGGSVASHADIAAINQSASKHLLLQTVGQYEPGETYTVEMRTFAAADGSAINADTTPILTATGNVSGSLSANLSAATNPATGVYRWTYTPGATPTLEQIRFDGSATIASSTFTLSAYSQAVDMPTAVFTATDQAHLTAIFNKLPTNAIADETVLDAAIAALGSPMQAGAAVQLAASQPNYAPAKAGDAMTLTAAYDAAKSAASQASVNALPTAAQIATAVLTDTADLTTQGSIGYVIAHQLGGAFTNGTSSVFTVAALANAPAGGGGGGSLDAYAKARLYGDVTPVASDGSQDFLDTTDGTTVRVRFRPTNPRGGRTVELDP